MAKKLTDREKLKKLTESGFYNRNSTKTQKLPSYDRCTDRSEIENRYTGGKNGSVVYSDNVNTESKTAEPKAEEQNTLNEAYRKAGRNPVRITDYAAPAGMGGISYSDNGMVSVGGRNIPVLYMDGERAVVDSNELDRAYSELQKQTGIKTAGSLYSDWQKSYGSRAEKAYDNMADYGDWKYDPKKDPAYLAYSDMYRREGDRAYRDAAAKIASGNMGNMTSAAQTVANQQLGYYMSMLADRIPELMENSYERYKNGFDMKKDVYNAAADDADKGWKRMYEVNDTNKKDYSDWLERERQRTLDRQNAELWKLTAEGQRLNNEFTGVKTEGDRLNNELTGVKTEGERIANETALLKKAAQEAANAQNAMENAWQNAERRGFYTDTERALWQLPEAEENKWSKYFPDIGGYRSGAAGILTAPQVPEIVSEEASVNSSYPVFVDKKLELFRKIMGI